LNKARITLPVLARDTDLSKLDAWIAGFLRVEASPGRAFPPEQAIEETIATLRREVGRYYPSDVSKAIERRRAELGDVSKILGAPLLVSRDAAKPDRSPQGSEGYHYWYLGGGGKASIYWSKRGGAQPVWGAIRAVYGGRGSAYGFPLTSEIPAGASPQGTDGKLQRFEGRQNYPEDITGPMKYGATIYWCAKHGAKTTWEGIGEYYERQGGTTSGLGFPVHSEHEAARSRRNTEGKSQEFEGGIIVWSESTGAASVRGEIAAMYSKIGGTGSWLGFPLGEESEAAVSSQGTTGTFQRFEGDWVYPDDVIRLLQATRCGATVYCSPKCGTYPTAWGIGVIYERMFGTGGVLGFPTSGEQRIPGIAPESADRLQRFEGGAIYYRASGNLIVPVLTAILEMYQSHGGPAGNLGFPLAPAEQAPSGGADKLIQRFEGGTITLSGSQVAVESDS
jgi:uncharacterized protein with LGFP repeats